MRNHKWCLFPLLVLLSACHRKPEAAATIEKYRSAVGARLAAVKQIGENLKTMPPLSSDGAALDVSRGTEVSDRGEASARAANA